MALNRIGSRILLDLDLIYAVRFTKVHENVGYPIEIAVFCDVPNAVPGQPYVNVMAQDDISSFLQAMHTSATHLKFISKRMKADVSKISAVFLSEDKKSGTISFRFAGDRGAPLELDANEAQQAITYFPWPEGSFQNVR